MTPADLGFALRKELQRGAVAAATLDAGIALLDVLLTWTRLEQPFVASLVASLVERDEATATATLRKLAACLAAPYPDHFWQKPFGLRPNMPLYAVVKACRRDERAAVVAAPDAVPGPWHWNADELEQAASDLALDNDAASVRELKFVALIEA
ncbi:hypothetical protein [Polyangium jinanense]|uniref:Uncharacterized protein n=1 Tax=Polyangium jinanense TaxID=2829994 RepID=A0A9X4ATF7_9BACT|nr:hypothetical protein [Polyangium jinanense]MDC3954360.1 hypothetical protein [Polyangium jinanense]MDC3984188.1 hypothetical protein [Polyangium jinanense]